MRPQEVDTNRDDAGEPTRFSGEELLARYDALLTTHGDHLDLFAVDPRPELETVKRAARRRLQKLELHSAPVAGLDAGGLKHDLDVLIERMESYHRRWGDLRAIFEKELKTFRTVKSTARRREEVLAATPEALRASEEARLNERFDRALRICEDFASELAKDGPSWTAREEELLREKWSELEKRSDAYLKAVAEAQALARAEEDARREEAVRARAEEEQRQRRLAAERRRKVALASEARREDRSEAIRSAADESEDARPPESDDASSADAEPTLADGRYGERRGGARDDEAAVPPSRWRAVPPLVWGLGGFVAATVVFFVIGRSRNGKNAI